MATILEISTDKVPAFVSCAQVFCDGFKFYANKTALVDLSNGHSITYAELLNKSHLLAAILRDRYGVKKGDVIALIAENSANFLFPLFAGLIMGVPVHMSNPVYTTYELLHILSLSLPFVVFASAKSLKSLNNLNEGETRGLIKNVICLDPITDNLANYTNLDEIMQLEYLFKTNELNDYYFPLQRTKKEDVALIFNSSGTTGLPKGVMITNEGIYLQFIHARTPWITTRPDKKHSNHFLVLPLFHIYGFSILAISLFLGDTLYISDGFEPHAFLDTIVKYKVPKLYLVPALVTFLARTHLIEKYNQSDFLSVREVFCASSPVGSAIIEEFLKRFPNSTFRQMYGLTETSAALAMTALHSDLSDSSSFNCGRICPLRLIRIIDTQTGNVLHANQTGEIRCKGGLMAGYINNEAATADAFDSDGYLKTGDLGYIDSNGNVFVIDRLKDLIKYKSFQVAPCELESVILQHNSVKDVCVVAKSDERCGELPVAFVARKSTAVTEKDIQSFVAEKLSSFKHLHGGVRFIDSIPKNRLGKPLRAKLRKIIEQE